jgi:hypothetical protein
VTEYLREHFDFEDHERDLDGRYLVFPHAYDSEGQPAVVPTLEWESCGTLRAAKVTLEDWLLDEDATCRRGALVIDLDTGTEVSFTANGEVRFVDLWTTTQFIEELAQVEGSVGVSGGVLTFPDGRSVNLLELR